MISWSCFTKILFIGQSMGKKQYAPKKAGDLKQRREILATGDESGYADKVMEMVREEEQAIQSFLFEVFDKLKLSD